MSLVTVASMDELYKATEIEEGQVAKIKDTEEYYYYHNNGWFPVIAEPTADGNLQLNLYELNRNIISQLPDYSDEQWEGAEKVFSDWLAKKTSKYFMLYGREISYFTIFKKRSMLDEVVEFGSLFDALKECLVSLGPVRSIAVNELEDGSSSIEIWVNYQDTVTCMYLFEYEEGIVVYE